MDNSIEKFEEEYRDMCGLDSNFEFQKSHLYNNWNKEALPYKDYGMNVAYKMWCRKEHEKNTEEAKLKSVLHTFKVDDIPSIKDGIINLRNMLRKERDNEKFEKQELEYDLSVKTSQYKLPETIAVTIVEILEDYMEEVSNRRCEDAPDTFLNKFTKEDLTTISSWIWRVRYGENPREYNGSNFAVSYPCLIAYLLEYLKGMYPDYEF